MKRYLNYINGEWVDSSSGKSFTNSNPADKEDVIGEFPESAPEDVSAAVDAARRSYSKWRLYPAPKRAEILYRAAEIILCNKEKYTHDMTREMGKVLKEAGGDVQEAIDMTYFIAGEGRRLHGHTTNSELPNKFMMSMRMPLGVAAVITPWNFPMAIPSWKIAPALVTGNTVIFKPAFDTPLTAHNFVKALEEAGVPPGVVNLIYGTGPHAGSQLVEHPDVSIVSFTGSTDTGRKINQAAASSFKRVSLEMGGKNAIIVMDDADVDLAVEGAVWGGFGTTGQRCTAASRLLLHEKIHDAFIEKFVNRVKALKVGNGLDPSIEMGPCINEMQLAKVEKYVEIGKGEGAKLKTGGHRLTEGALSRGNFFAPTIFTEVSPQMRIAREEIFGPVVSAIRIRDLEDAIRICNETIYGLSSAIYTGNINQAFRAMRDINTGITYINSSTIGAEVHLPFGGTKQTGTEFIDLRFL